MAKLSDILAKDRRLVILRFLSEDDDYKLNASVLNSAVSSLGHKAGHDIMEADLKLLEEHDLVSLEYVHVPGGSVTIAKLTKLGLEVSKGRSHPVVARPSPEF